MNDRSKRREFKLVESDDVFWDDLREISERLDWELGQTLKTCFVFGWDRLANIVQETINDDSEELE